MFYRHFYFKNFSQFMNRRIFVLFPLLLIISIGYSTVSAQDLDSAGFNRVFDPYIGVWQGEYRIYSQQDKLLNQFKVNRNYWWDGAILMERVSYDFGEVKQTYFHRIVLSEGMPFSFVTDNVDPEKIRSALRGENVKGTLIWSRVLPKESLPVRISERIVRKEGELYIEFWGDQEAKDHQGDSILVRIEGFLAYLPDSRNFVVASDNAAEVIEQPVIEKTMEPEKVWEPEIRPKPEVEIEPNPKPVFQKPEIRNVPPPVPVLEADPVIQLAIDQLNIIGINDEAGEECIVVDYFLLYKLGERLDMKQVCVFTGVDATYLYFEDFDGYEYRLFRKDAIE